VKSSALALGARTRPVVGVFYVLAFGLIAAAISPSRPGVATFAVLAAAAGHLAWQVWTLNIADPVNCLRRFRANRDFGLLILAAAWVSWNLP
jgi:4-hydroxybenzoate polyprenyltransferase